MTATKKHLVLKTRDVMSINERKKEKKTTHSFAATIFVWMRLDFSMVSMYACISMWVFVLES